jgi:hypothetical protein
MYADSLQISENASGETTQTIVSNSGPLTLDHPDPDLDQEFLNTKI